MESQSGARTALVDPFGRELEAWLRDAPATRTPYLADLVVPPVTGPVQRPDAAAIAAAAATVPAVDAPVLDVPVADATAADVHSDDTAFRRPRDRARHAAACAPSFPEPPERLALQIDDLAVEVSASSGRTTIERIVLLEDEVRRRDEDLARLAAWEATVAEDRDPEVEAARAFARTVFADLLADAADEADRRARAAARRIAAGNVAIVPTRAPVHAAVHVTEPTAPVPALVVPAVTADADDLSDLTVAPVTTPERELAVRPVLSLPVVSPVSANTRPTPLVQPATGPTVIDRAAFAAALTAHVGTTASTPVVLPDAVAPGHDATRADRSSDADRTTADSTGPEGWWARLVVRLLRALGRR